MIRKTVVLLIAAVAAVPAKVWGVDLTVDASVGNSPYERSSDGIFGTVLIGSSTTGEARQTGGTTTVTSDFQLGVVSSASGVYRLEAGTLSLNQATARVGYAGSGSIVQTGGMLTSSVGGILLGASTGSNGDYAISGGTAALGTIGVGSSGTGTFTIDGGSVAAAINLAAAAGSSGTLNLNGGVLQTGRVAKGSGTSVMNYNGAIVRFTPATGGNSIEAGTSRVQAGGAVFDVASGLSATVGYFTHDSSLDTTPDGGLTKLGSGTLALDGSNTYTGATTLAGGTVVVSSGVALGKGAVRFAGGTLAFTNNFDTDVSARFDAAGNQPISIDVRTGTGFYEAPVSFASNLTGESTSLTKLGIGTLRLLGTNTYTGKTTVTAGTLGISRPASLAGYDVPGRVSVGGSGTLALTASLWSADQITAVATNAAFATGAKLALNQDADSPGYVFSTIDGTLGGAIRYTKTGAGTILLSGSNTFTGGINVSAGTLIAATPAALPGYAVSGKVSNGGVLAVRVGGPGEWTVDDIHALRVNNRTGIGVLGFDTTNAPAGFTYADAFVDPSSSVTGLAKLGPNTLTLTALNTYFGDTRVNEGTLAIPSGGLPHSNVLATGGTLALSGSGVIGSTADAAILTANGAATSPGAITIADNAAVFFAGFYVGGQSGSYGYLGGNGRVTQTGGSVIASTGNSVWIATDSFSNGIYEVSGGTLSAGGLLIASGQDSTGTFAQSGGVVTLTGNATVGSYSSSYSKNTAALLLTGGTMDLGTNTLTLATASANSTESVISGTATLSGGRLRVGSISHTASAGTGILNFNGGTLSPTKNNTAFIGGVSARVQAGGAIIDTAGFNIGIPQSLVHDPALGATRDGGLTKAGSGTLTLSVANTYTGTTTIEAGVLATTTTSYPSLVSNSAGGIDLKGARGKFTIQHFANDSVAAQVRAFLVAGFASNFSAGKIRSTTATAARGLGYADTGTSIKSFIVMATLYGDADLDGGVSINDFNALAGNFGQSTGKVWTEGDFDYDGGVSINDFNLLAGGFGQSLPAASPMWAGLLSFAAAHNDLTVFEAVTGVPEPTSLMTVVLGASAVTHRRKRRPIQRVGNRDL